MSHPYLAAVNLPIGHPFPDDGSPQPARLDPSSFALVSVDDNAGDVDLDIVVVARESAAATARSARLLRNDTVGGNLALTLFGNVPGAGIAPTAVLAADIDDDGLNDVVTFNSTGFRADGGRGGGTQPGIDLQLKRDVPPAYSVGDLNCDGFVTVGDIRAFVLALTNPAQYAIEFANCDLQLADANGDGFVTVGDIGSFVALLTGG